MFTSIQNITIHYKIEGGDKGTPLVFANSLGTDFRIWDEVVALLGTTHPIIRYDKRGHGLSDCPAGPYTIQDHANDLIGLLDHLQVKQAILIGISVGGLIAMQTALSQPELVRGLVLCNTGAKIGSFDLWNTRIAAIQQQGLAAIASNVLARWFTPHFAQSQPDNYRGYGNMLSRIPSEGYMATCAALRDADLREAVKSITVPTLVMCGDADLATPPELSEQLVTSLPNARLAWIKDASHISCVEQPEQVAEQIRQFILTA